MPEQRLPAGSGVVEVVGERVAPGTVGTGVVGVAVVGVAVVGVAVVGDALVGTAVVGRLVLGAELIGELVSAQHAHSLALPLTTRVQLGLFVAASGIKQRPLETLIFGEASEDLRQVG